MTFSKKTQPPGLKLLTVGINDPAAGLLLLTQPPVQSSQGQQAGDVDHAPLCVPQMMLDSLKTVCPGTVFSLQCVLMSLVWDFKEIKIFFFFLSKLSGFLLASPLQGSGDLASSLSPELTSGPGEKVPLAFV